MTSTKTSLNFMTLISQLITLIRNSPKRLVWFQESQDKEAPCLKPLCPMCKGTSLTDSALHRSSNEKGEAGRRGKTSGRFVRLQEFRTFCSLKLRVNFFSRFETVRVVLQKLHHDTLRSNMQVLWEEFTEFWKTRLKQPMA